MLLCATSVVADPSVTPTPIPQDLTNVPVTQLQEAHKNPNTTYQIGDRINFITVVKIPNVENGEHLSLKVPEGSSKLEDQGWYVDPSSEFMGGNLSFIASPIQTGNLTLPTLLIVKDDQTILMRTLPFSAKVTGPDQEKIKPAEYIDVSTSSLAAKYWIIFSLLLLAVISGISYFIYRYLKKRKKAPPARPKGSDETDHAIALRKIDALYRKYPYELDNMKVVAFGISEALKEFFSHRFKIDATEATTDEMLLLLKKQSLSDDSLREIKALYQNLDLIKFTTADHYRHFDEEQYLDFKVKAQFIVQKWALKPIAEETKP
jgi:hypothetical protein